ncbi:hypothetical protein BGZ83_003727 [Gryganskiella cystojenkinii]|nr:hypothetical protein BGZ83_003727 [Gryganskiella cystojenkinii]
MYPHEYTFLFALGMIFAFLDSYGIGANDVSNSFSAAVGSKALNLKQAVLIASVCEFLGAFLMGSATADTIKGGLIDVELFASQPEILLLGMVCSLVGSSSWVLFASSRGWPVSTTHAIVGAITGVGIAFKGASAVQWVEIGKIVSSWLISPICAGLVTMAIFLITKFLILEHENSLQRGLTAIPFYFAITIFINVFYIIFKGSPGLSLSQMPIGVILGISFGTAGAVFLWCFFMMRPYLRRKIETGENLKWYHCLYIPFVKTRVAPAPQAGPTHPKFASSGSEKGSTADPSDTPLSPHGLKIKTMEEAFAAHEEPHGEVNSGLAALDDTKGPTRGRKLFNAFKARVTHGMDQDINKNTEEITQIHDNSTRYDAKTELLFCTLQVLTSCFASFAHGSNDVANAIGPLTTIYYIWKNGGVDITGKAPIPTWILAYGGIAIDIGLLTYGYKVMATLGNKITFISPSRGFSVSLGTSLTVLTCSKLGMPVSTTHCITGATTSVGLVGGGGRKSINWRMLGLVASSWIFTLPAAGLVSGLLFALIINSPHKA